MATGDQLFAVAARSCALFLLLLLLTGSFPAARSSTETEVAGTEAGSFNNNSTVATEGPHGGSAAAVKTSEVAAPGNLIDVEAIPVEDECFEVCCWQGDAECPYPYCNYNQSPCNGE